MTRSKHKKNREYLLFVAFKSCLFCGKTPAGQAHHVRSHTGWGRKPSDYQTIALCYEHHDLIHNDPRLFYETVTKTDVYKAMFEQLVEWLELDI